MLSVITSQHKNARGSVSQGLMEQQKNVDGEKNLTAETLFYLLVEKGWLIEPE